MPPLAAVAAALAAGFAVAWLAYGRRAPEAGRAWPFVLLRGTALSLLAILLADLSCATGPLGRRPLVLLDGSLSMDAAGGAWPAALDSARRWGEVRTFGDDRGADTAPDRGASDLAPALAAAAAAGRSVVVVTDGELDDGEALPADLLDAAEVRVFPRTPLADVAVTGFTAPEHVALDDTLEVAVTLGRWNGAADSAVVALSGERPLGRARIRFGTGASAAATFEVPARELGPGDHLLRAAVATPGDREPRDDERWALVDVAPQPGIVLLASPPDWDSRQLYRTLRDVADLPVRGFARMGGRWWTMETMAPASEASVLRAAAAAALLVVQGDQSLARRGSRALWSWPAGESGPAPAAGDWYAEATGVSPLAGAWVGVPFDSLPPLVEVAPVEARRGEWVALSAVQGRRGAARAVVLGGDSAGRRHLLVSGQGLWRWAFAGGAAEEAYRAWVAASVAWLLGGGGAGTAAALPVRSVVPRGMPVIFEWAGGAVPMPTAIAWSGDSGRGADTLRFDGSGRAELRLPVGRFTYRLSGGGQGVVAVEPWSREWLPRAPTIGARPRRAAAAATDRVAVRERLWIFGLILAALAAEWTLRRRRGFR